MGLAASHARLCMLTRRKSDVEARLMRVSNAKMQLARDSEKVSKEYTRALNATSLVYNMGNKDVDLTYGLIMSPTTQCMLTNSAGNVVLDNAIWTALGSPAQGAALGDEKAFIAKMANIDASTIDLDKLNASNPTAGVNTPADTKTLQTSFTTADVFKDLSRQNSAIKDFWGKPVTFSPDGSAAGGQPICVWQGETKEIDDKGKVWGYLYPTLANILDGASDAAVKSVTKNLGTSGTSDVKTALDNAAKLATDATIDYYQNQLMTNIRVGDNAQSKAKGSNQIFDDFKGYDNDKHEVYIDPNQVVLTFIGFFEVACQGALTEANENTYKLTNKVINLPGGASTNDNNLNKNQTTSAIIDPTRTQSLNIKYTPSTTGSTTAQTATPASIITYYYNLYEAIKTRGWVLDADVDNKDYMQGMIQFGGYGVKKYENGTWVELSQNSPDSPISAVTSDEIRDKAKADYDAKKDAIKAKEVEWDVEQTAADTERAAIVADMDSVKKILDKNMDSFKLFQQG